MKCYRKCVSGYLIDGRTGIEIRAQVNSKFNGFGNRREDVIASKLLLKLNFKDRIEGRHCLLCEGSAKTNHVGNQKLLV